MKPLIAAIAFCCLACLASSPACGQGENSDMTPIYFDRDARVLAPVWKVPDLTSKHKQHDREHPGDLTFKEELKVKSRKDLGANPDAVIRGKDLSRSETSLSFRFYTDRVKEWTTKMGDRTPTSTDRYYIAPTTIYSMGQTHSYRTFALAAARGTVNRYISEGPTISTVPGR